MPLYKDPMSSYVYLDDEESLTIIHIFKNAQFEYSPMSGRPIQFHYLALKDAIKWADLEPRKYVPLLNAMCRNFVKYLPSK